DDSEAAAQTTGFDREVALLCVGRAPSPLFFKESRFFFFRAVENKIRRVPIPEGWGCDTRHDPWLGGQQWLNVGRRQRRKQRRRRGAGSGSFSLTQLPDLRPYVSEIASYGPACVMV